MMYFAQFFHLPNFLFVFFMLVCEIQVSCYLGFHKFKILSLVAQQSRFVDKPDNFQEVCPQNGTVALKGL